MKSNNQMVQYVGVGILATVIIILLVGFLGWSPETGRMENAVTTQVEICIGQMTQGFNTIVEVNSLRQDQQEFLYSVFADALNGNPESTKELIAFVAALNGTDLNAATIQTMQVIEAQRAGFANCQAEIQRRQLYLQNQWAGPIGRMYAGWFDFPHALPLNAVARPVNDLDGDGLISVLDYPVISAGNVLQMQSSGEDQGPLNLNATATP